VSVRPVAQARGCRRSGPNAVEAEDADGGLLR
jgi:hypothetical protein